MTEERKIVKIWVDVLGPYESWIQEIQVIDNNISKSMAEYRKVLGRYYRVRLNSVIYEDELENY